MKTGTGPKKAVTIVQQSGKWIVTVRTDDSTAHTAFATEQEARHFEEMQARKLGLK